MAVNKSINSYFTKESYMKADEFINNFNKMNLSNLSEEDYLRLADVIEQNMPLEEFFKFRETGTGRIFGDLVSFFRARRRKLEK